MGRRRLWRFLVPYLALLVAESKFNKFITRAQTINMASGVECLTVGAKNGPHSYYVHACTQARKCHFPIQNMWLDINCFEQNLLLTAFVWSFIFLYIVFLWDPIGGRLQTCMKWRVPIKKDWSIAWKALKFVYCQRVKKCVSVLFGKHIEVCVNSKTDWNCEWKGS